MRKADHRSNTAVRCAIYTRKSSDEGLEQEFNSLDAQREACEAYVVSQRHAGWVAVLDMYDDGGLSGGTMERPALQRLLNDIKAGKVQIVVVYKVDRLTRSLADFAKVVDVLDEHDASFVSVTQQFNTTTSMGRLTLNMLLSFAQFEREIAGERIRDKIAASKAKGMWMGGNVPLGYDVKDRKLIVNEAEANTVRLIFQRYAELGSVALLRAELDRLSIVSKRREGAAGRLRVANPSPEERSTHCSRTTFIGVRSPIRAMSIRASMKPSSIGISGSSCRASSRPIVRSDHWVSGLKHPAC